MEKEAIQLKLSERFAEPLPEFYKRRIIFWKDEDKEFENIVDELSLNNVIIKKATGNNNFVLKKLLSEDDLTNNYLVYNTITYEDKKDNWLRDIELYSEEFRADRISMQMEELRITTSNAMRKTVKLYAKFFENKERKTRLKKIGRGYMTPIQLHIDIMAVLCGLNGGSANDVIIAVLCAGLDKENNPALINIEKFGNIDAFWSLVRRYTGYMNEDDKPLGFLASHILLTALSQTISPSVIKGLERFISETSKAYCYSLVHEWQFSEKNAELLEICRGVERELQLVNRFEKAEIEALLTSDTFPCINECILKRFFDEISEQVIKTDLILKTVENRRTLAWSDLTTNYFDCLYHMAKMQEFYLDHIGGFHIVEPQKIWELYSDDYYIMDSYYRHFHYAFGNTLKDSNSYLDDSLKHDVDYVEGLYQNWFLKELTACWTNAISEDLKSIGYITDITKQRDFYNKYVVPTNNKKTHAFVIISDALRYEVASELVESLNRTAKGKATMETMQAVFPSITKFGMAALLPNKTISVNEGMEVFVDGTATDTTLKREEILRRKNIDSIAIQYNDLLKLKHQDRRELTSGKEIVYIYHDAIDSMAHNSEFKVFEACKTAIQELSNIVRMVVNELNGTNVLITADHGFLYTYNPLEESQKISKTIFDMKVYESGRRYALAGISTSTDYLLPVSMEREIDGVKLKGYTPQDTIRIRKSGGGENYVHGGISLQEILLPVIVYKNVRTDSKQFVEVKNVELALLSESRKISNLMFSLDFYQKTPVGGKIQSCSYNIYMVDEEDAPISDRHVIIADRYNENAQERVFRERFNLKSITFDKNKIYRLIISNDVDVPIEIEFHIDIPFADDFGFDLW